MIFSLIAPLARLRPYALTAFPDRAALLRHRRSTKKMSQSMGKSHAGALTQPHVIAFRRKGKP
jgi:hypothetical protein